MSKLIALVATAVMVDGVRTVIQPGQPLPELAEHDAKALQDSGAANDPAVAEAAAAAAQKAADKAAEDFEANRQAVQARQGSINPDVGAAASAKPAAKAAKKS